jgi:hypothetical protein
MANRVQLTYKDLKSDHRPVMPSFAICASGPCWCSSSVNVKLPGQSTVYLITASHCTALFGEYDGQPWWQWSSGTLGNEAIDADWFYCHGGMRCVLDAALRYNSADSAAFGKIAKPTATGSTMVNEQTPLNIFAEEHLVFEEDYVEKLGVTYGYAHSFVTLTCADMVSHSANIVSLCSNKTTYWSCGGDSGGSVFTSGFPWVPSTTDAVYWGINIARDGPPWPEANCGAGWFSGIAQIELAYGNLITY